jgi:putative Mg2+ transporter-C (MgtC) family protein
MKFNNSSIYIIKQQLMEGIMELMNSLFESMGPWTHTYEFSVVFRLVLATLFGGYIGAERIRKRRPAGIKTHSIVSLGAALVVLTNEFMLLNINPDTDIARLAGQVVSGIGFLGAGTIMVTGRNQVRGLTTAAGIWLSACIGIAVGIGFYWAAFTAMVLLTFINGIMGKIDLAMQSRSKIMNLIIDCTCPDVVNHINKVIIESGCSIISHHAHKQESITGIEGVTSVATSIFINKNIKHKVLTEKISLVEGVIAVEEI